MAEHTIGNSPDLSIDTEDDPSSRTRLLTIVNRNNGTKYIIKKQLGKGGYGTVFLCLDPKNRIRALKTERDSALTQEIKIFQEAQKRKCTHIAKLYDYGFCNEFLDPFLLMTCLGKNLADIKKHLPKKMFTKSTTLRVLMQTLSGIHELHTLGYISRDIKPSNFCIGRPSIAPKSIFIIDFGVARDFRNDNELTIVKEYSVTSFKGTVRYCSLANHQFKKQCRRDDVESWFYMAYEFFEGKLPWQRIPRKSRQRIKDIKTILRTPTPKMFAQTPKFMHDLLLDIDKIKFLEKPNYAHIHNLLHTTFTENGHNYQDLYDWEGHKNIVPIDENMEEELTSEDISKKNIEKIN